MSLPSHAEIQLLAITPEVSRRGRCNFSFFGQVSNRKVRTVQYSCVPGTPKIWTLVTVFARRLVPPKVQDSAHLSGNCKAGLSLPAHAEVYLTRVCRRPRGAGWGVLFYLAVAVMVSLDKDKDKRSECRGIHLNEPAS
jgi:hypothetical protein